MPSRTSGEDPLARAIAPPRNESQLQKAERLRVELEAKKRSDAIDEEINKQRASDKKGPLPIKILLLGSYSNHSSPHPQGKLIS
jgi:guanine nucleotide-binding protein alpha-1 subunit